MRLNIYIGACLQDVMKIFEELHGQADEGVSEMRSTWKDRRDYDSIKKKREFKRGEVVMML